MSDPPTHFTLASRRDALADAQATLSRLLAGYAIPPRQVFLAELVFEEVTSNIVRHAWPQGGAGTIEVSISRRADEVVMQFEDGGVPFDPLTHPPAPTAVSLADARAGGFGLLLVRKVARDARYRREADRNLLTVTIGPDWAS